MKISRNVSIWVLLLLLNVNPAFADYLRCGLDLISEGDIKVKVLRSCGEPLFIQRSSLFDSEFETSTFEGWVYEKNDYYYILHFRGLRVVWIERSHKNLP